MRVWDSDVECRPPDKGLERGRGGVEAERVLEWRRVQRGWGKGKGGAR